MDYSSVVLLSLAVTAWAVFIAYVIRDDRRLERISRSRLPRAASHRDHGDHLPA